jgi:hypothetical protein
MKTILSVAAVGLLVSTGAFAQNTNATAVKESGNQQSSTATTANQDSIRQEVRANLQQAGFTDIKVMPDSFFVRAKDKSGNPVAMIINPDSVTEVVDEGSAGGPGAKAAGKQGSGRQPADVETNGPSGTFASVPVTARMTSSLVGLPVYDQAKQDVGTIKDVAYANSHVEAYIIGVGGFLGMGDHYVAVKPSAMNISYDHSDNKWHAVVDATPDQLKSAPAYNYPKQG